MRCHAVDSSFKNQFLHTVRKSRLRADIIFLAPQDFYFNEKNTKKLLEKRTTSSKFWGLGSPTNRGRSWPVKRSTSMGYQFKKYFDGCFSGNTITP